MMTSAATVTAVLATGQGAAPESTHTGFAVGVASRDITPQPGIAMWGYSDREGPSTGTLDPLYAKAVVFSSGDETVAVVSLDLGRVPMQGACDRIRARARAKGIDHVFLCATHTHQGPVMEFDDEPHARAIEQGIGDAIEAAAADLRPARLGLKRTSFDISHNRRVLIDGKCYMLWRNEERRPTSPLDQEAAVIRIDGEDGRPLAVLVNFACHPVVMGPSNRQYSGDYCGELARIVKEKTGAECLFLQGGCGDVNPYLDKTPIDAGGVEAMRSVGRECADAVLRLWEGIATSAPAAPSVGARERMVEVGTRWDLSDPAVQKLYRDRYGALFDKYLKSLKDGLKVPLATLVLNDNVAFAFMPGELFTQHQIDLKHGSPVADTFLCGYANDFHLYFPTIKDAAAGGYGGAVATYVGLGAGETLVKEALIDIGHLTGRLRPEPIAEDFNLLELEDIPA